MVTPASHSTAPPALQRRIAVIGSGVSGLTAAYVLQRGAQVTLFEADDRLGGHAHTHDVAASDGSVIAIDSGFIVHNEATYPSLMRLFGELDVATQPTEMSMSIHCDGCGLEYAGGRGLRAVFAQPRRAVDPRFLWMLGEVKRFHLRAKRLLAEPPARSAHLDVRAFLEEGRFSAWFRRHFVVPLISCVWSSGDHDALRYPARHLFAFLDNHGMLSVKGSHDWRTVVGGSRTYVERAAKSLSAVSTMAPVRSVRRTPDGVEVHDDDDVVHEFDDVVIATHADQALAMLDAPTEAERSVLGSFGYSRNATVLHTDDTVLPTSRRARASWNYRMRSCDATADHVMVNYWMNRLQCLDQPVDYVVSLNAGDIIDERERIATMSYEHPVFTLDAVAAQARLPSLNRDRLAFAGAYQGWGFHEDGCVSGVRAASSLGVEWDTGSR